MGRKPDDFSVWRRPDTGYFVYRLRGWPRGKRKSTGTKKPKEANRIAYQAFQEQNESRNTGSATLGEILETAFDWNRCVHVKRYRDEGKHISQKHAANSRRLIEMYVLNDKICELPVKELARRDFLDLRDRIRSRTTVSQTNRTMVAVRTILNERKYRQDISLNPSDGVGKLAEKKAEIGVFTQKELAALFQESPGVWGNIQAYAAYLLASTTCMRRGEILALTWRQINFETKEICVDRAVKGNGEVGDPKWGKVRTTFLPKKVAEALREIRNRSMYVLPDSLVICDANGKRRGWTWWEKRFVSAMKNAGIDREGRNLRPRSLRHSVATLLRAGGIDSAAIRASTGWSDESIQDNCTYWQVDHFAKQRKMVDSIFPLLATK